MIKKIMNKLKSIIIRIGLIFVTIFYRILIIGGSGLDKTNVLSNSIKYQQQDIDKTYFYVKDSFESNYQKRKIGN